MGIKIKNAIKEFFRKDHPSGKSWKRRAGEAYIIFKFRSNRGNALTGEITSLFAVAQKAGILLLLVNQYFHWLVPIKWIVILWLINRIFEYFLGLWDFKHFGWWKFETDYSSRELNPWNTELMERIVDIQNKINNTKKYEPENTGAKIA